jgi:hypothetical protein
LKWHSTWIISKLGAERLQDRLNDPFRLDTAACPHLIDERVTI